MFKVHAYTKALEHNIRFSPLEVAVLSRILGIDVIISTPGKTYRPQGKPKAVVKLLLDHYALFRHHKKRMSPREVMWGETCLGEEQHWRLSVK